MAKKNDTSKQSNVQEDCDMWLSKATVHKGTPANSHRRKAKMKGMLKAANPQDPSAANLYQMEFSSQPIDYVPKIQSRLTMFFTKDQREANRGTSSRSRDNEVTSDFRVASMECFQSDPEIANPENDSGVHCLQANRVTSSISRDNDVTSDFHVASMECDEQEKCFQSDPEIANSENDSGVHYPQCRPSGSVVYKTCIGRAMPPSSPDPPNTTQSKSRSPSPAAQVTYARDSRRPCQPHVTLSPGNLQESLSQTGVDILMSERTVMAELQNQYPQCERSTLVEHTKRKDRLQGHSLQENYTRQGHSSREEDHKQGRYPQGRHGQADISRLTVHLKTHSIDNASSLARSTSNKQFDSLRHSYPNLVPTTKALEQIDNHLTLDKSRDVIVNGISFDDFTDDYVTMDARTRPLDFSETHSSVSQSGECASSEGVASVAAVDPLDPALFVDTCSETLTQTQVSSAREKGAKLQQMVRDFELDLDLVQLQHDQRSGRGVQLEDSYTGQDSYDTNDSQLF